MSTPRLGFNYRISAFFLNNLRLTVLAFCLLIVIGTGTVLALKTTGFPNATINLALIVTPYPGAAADTVANKITAPLEGVIKDIAGVKTFSSRSSNSVSVITITIDSSANAESVRSKIATAVNSIVLPAGAQTPQVSSPSIGGPSIILAISANDTKKLYEVYQQAVHDIQQIPETATVTPLVDLEKQVVVTLDTEKLKPTGLTYNDVQRQLSGINETLPVISDIALDSENQSLVTTLPGTTLHDIEQLEFISTTVPPAKTYHLTDFAKVTEEYRFANPVLAHVGFQSQPNFAQTPTVVLMVKSVADINLTTYTTAIEQLLSNYPAAHFYTSNPPELADTPIITEVFTANTSNEHQVAEVVSGLVGGPLEFDSPIAQVGWILGGIQLVFLVMVALVSWRAAIVAALSIPLSLLFSTIYLYATGNNLNTLVLFSLVLAIGLVVDPALVILEAIQRKIDTGLRGKTAVLAAVKDVGNGLFLAALTNVIVFFPFAVVSGLLGEIFSYIPLTIIPAIIGSYIVPLIFLAWLGGLFLKPRRSKNNDEAKNLWSIAKWLIRCNESILRGPKLLRLGIIILAIVVPISMAGYYFSSGKIVSVQFASSTNADTIAMNGTFLPTLTTTEREELTQTILKTVVKNKAVKSVFPMENGWHYMIQLWPASERGNYRSVDVVQDLTNELASIQPKFLDLTIAVQSNGPPKSPYDVTLSIADDNPDTLQTTATAVAATLTQVCSTNNTIAIDAACTNGELIIEKVDDGYTNKETTTIEVLLDQAKLTEKRLILPSGPISLVIHQQLRQLFSEADNEAVGTVELNGTATDIILLTTAIPPTTIDEIRNTEISFGPQTIRLDDIATVQEKTGQANIQRVNGQTVTVVQGRLKPKFSNQGVATQVTAAVVDYYHTNNITQYSEGDSASFVKSFQELLIALVLAIILTYVVLVLFFESFTLPLVIIFSVPLTFIGVFPALSAWSNGQFGFLEIIGLIILVGIVENVAIFLIDAAKQKIKEDNWDPIIAISYASGVRLRPVLLTKLTCLASLAPLALFSEFYRSIAIVIMFGLLTSGITSLFTTPILFMFFDNVSNKIQKWTKHS